MQCFLRNAKRIDEIVPVVSLNGSIKDLVKTMGSEPDVGMLIVEMFRQQNNPDALSASDMILLLNMTIRKTPTLIDDETGMNSFLVFIPFFTSLEQMFQGF